MKNIFHFKNAEKPWKSDNTIMENNKKIYEFPFIKLRDSRLTLSKFELYVLIALLSLVHFSHDGGHQIVTPYWWLDLPSYISVLDNVRVEK